MKSALLKLSVLVVSILFWSQLIFWSNFSGLSYYLFETRLKKLPDQIVLTQVMSLPKKMEKDLFIGRDKFLSIVKATGVHNSNIYIQIEEEPEILDMVNIYKTLSPRTSGNLYFECRANYWTDQRAISTPQNLSYLELYRNLNNWKLIPRSSIKWFFNTLEIIFGGGESSLNFTNVERYDSLRNSTFELPHRYAKTLLSRLETKEGGALERLFWVCDKNDLKLEMPALTKTKIKHLYEKSSYFPGVGNITKQIPNKEFAD